MLGRELSSGTQAIAPPPHQQEFKHFYELPMMKNCEIPQRTSKCPYSAEKKKKKKKGCAYQSSETHLYNSTYPLLTFTQTVTPSKAPVSTLSSSHFRHLPEKNFTHCPWHKNLLEDIRVSMSCPCSNFLILCFSTTS